MKLFKGIIGERVRKIPIKEIYIHPSNIRLLRSDDKIREMADSIKRKGLEYPIKVVDKSTDQGRYGCVDGGYRIEAVKKLGWEEIPALVVSGTEDELMLGSWETDKTFKLNVIEEATFYKRLMGDRASVYGAYKEAADKAGKPYHIVRQALKLLELPEKVRRLLLEDKISIRTAIALRRQPRELWENIADKIEAGTRPVDVMKLGESKRMENVSIAVTPEEKEKLMIAAKEREQTLGKYCYELVRTNPVSPIKEG